MTNTIVVGDKVSGRDLRDSTWSHEIGLIFTLKRRRNQRPKYVCQYPDGITNEYFDDIIPAPDGR